MRIKRLIINILETILMLGFTALPCFSPAHANEDNAGDLADVNFPVIYFAERLSSNQAPRPELLLQLPFGTLSEDAGDSGLLPAIMSIHTLVYVKNSDFWAATNGLGKLYYYQSNLISETDFFLPSITLYRLNFISYRNAAGQSDDAGVDTWLVPGFQYTKVLRRPISFHIEAELHDYAGLDNYRIRAGFSYMMYTSLTLSAVYDRQSWHIRTDEDIVNLEMKGHSDTMYLRSIYRFKKGRKLTGWNASLSAGYEILSNRGNPALLQPADIDRNAFTLQIAIALGLLAW